MLHNRLWIHREIPEEEICKMSVAADISPLMAKVFLSRGIDDPAYVRKFLNPSLDDLNDPFLLEDMEKAVLRIIRAISGREKIIIYGDYDVDGITSTSVLYNFLYAHGAIVDYYIPDRLDEGYGLSTGAIDKIHAMGATLIITVDCGITAIDEVRYINDCGIDVIVTDHHECKDDLPEAYAVVSPCRPDSRYPFKELAGVGVVFKLIEALCKRMGLGSEYLDYIDLVALGTIADVVPLVDENRIIARYGIERMESTSNAGLKCLIDGCGIKGKPITSFSISFAMAPRVNAAGRIGDAGRAVRLFTTRDENEAAEIVFCLNEENKLRQDTEADILQQATALIDADENYKREKVLVVAGEGWHHGVIGIVASKITEKYFKPCILLSIEENTAKGSGRSIDGFDLFKALSQCHDLLEKFGGHELAAGLSLKTGNVSPFRERINAYADQVLSNEDLMPRIKIDVCIGSDDVNICNAMELEAMAPFGAGNPVPVFQYDGLKVNEIRKVGDGKHLRLKVEDEGFFADAIGFNMGSMADKLSQWNMLDAVCSLEINSWNAVKRVQLNLKDIRASSNDEMKDEYFYSLDQCMNVDYLKSHGNADRFCEADKENISMISWNEALEVAKAKNRVVFLVNALESAWSLEKKLKKTLSAVKKSYKICYTNFDSSNSGLIHIVINPEAGKACFDNMEYVFFYGVWINKAYMDKLISKIEKAKKFYINDGIKHGFNADEIVPDRKDLAAVYQHIKTNSDGNLLCNDMFLLAKRIANSHKINMNYFKVKKSIEIFEELNLIKREELKPGCIMLKVVDNGKHKADLDSSRIYRSLQALKTRLKEA